jgi:iron-sulfur cluster assembly protein
MARLRQRADHDSPHDERTFRMLTLTAEAASEIRNLTDRPELPDTAGLRIANDAGQGSLTLSLAAVPAEDDTVLATSGARLFLDAEAVEALDEKVLDTVPDSEGRVQFAIAQQD